MKGFSKKQACIATIVTVSPIGRQLYPYQNPKLTAEQRITDVLERLTLKRKNALRQNASPAILQLGIKAYDWWNETLHGIGRAGRATVSLHPIGIHASSDEAKLPDKGTSDIQQLKKFQIITL